MGKGCFRVVKILICAIPGVGGFLHFLAAYENIVGYGSVFANASDHPSLNPVEGRGQILIGIACTVATVFLYRAMSRIENQPRTSDAE